jgi:protease-4
MDEIYTQFKQHVLNVRQARLTKDLDQLAGGRVYTGQQAKELGLIDQLGGLDDAVKYVARKAGLTDYDIRIVPRPKNFMELFSESLQGGEGDDPRLSLALRAAGSHATPSVVDLALPRLRGLEPDRLRAVTAALAQLKILEQEEVSLTMPIMYFPQH